VGQLSCCGNSSWILDRDLPSAAGFEYTLGKCDRCGKPWMNVFCAASGLTGFEPVAPSDLEPLHSIADGPELKEFVRRWGERNL